MKQFLKSSTKLSKILVTMKHYLQDTIPNEATFKRGFFSLFWYYLKQILGSDV